MKSAQQKIHAQIGKDRTDKPEDSNNGYPFAPPASQKSGMEIKCINEPGNQRPRFFRVPTPIPAPGLIRPHSPEDETTKSEYRETHSDALIREFLEQLRRQGKRCNNISQNIAELPDYKDQSSARQITD